MVGRVDELRAELSSPAAEKVEKPARWRRLFCVGLVLAIPLAACERKEAREPTNSSVAASGPVDSILPIEEALRRFRADLPSVDRLEGGASSRDALVRAFVRAVERNDTTTVRRLHVTKAEYAYLYFPTSIYMSEPYRQPPELAWLLAAQSSEKGIGRVLRRLGGRHIAFAGYDCTAETREGANAFWRSCTVDYLDPETGTRLARRLFGTIIARDGHFKFLTYANDF